MYTHKTSLNTDRGPSPLISQLIFFFKRWLSLVIRKREAMITDGARTNRRRSLFATTTSIINSINNGTSKPTTALGDDLLYGISSVTFPRRDSSGIDSSKVLESSSSHISNSSNSSSTNILSNAAGVVLEDGHAFLGPRESLPLPVKIIQLPHKTPTEV